MKETILNIKTKDGLSLHTYVWEPVGNIQSVIQIVHGSIEHAKRYREFGRFMSNNGVAVIAYDMRGHGRTVKDMEDLAYYNEHQSGFELLMSDIRDVTDWIKKRYTDLDIHLMAHSMGTFITRAYLPKNDFMYKSVILSGTGGSDQLKMSASKTLINIIRKFKGNKHRSEFLHKLAYDDFNKNCKHSESSSAFISNDLSVIQRYDDDQYCGVTVTLDYLYEMIKSVENSQKDSSFELENKKVPILFISGELDLVGGASSHFVRKVAERYKKKKQEIVEIKIYPNGRHEMLNEPNREEVYQDILEWIS
jgi:alpha-beta hydrolase superfamily lysophospholipase